MYFFLDFYAFYLGFFIFYILFSINDFSNLEKFE